MSQFNQTLQRAIPATPGKAQVEFYVNMYRQPDGNIRPGARVFRKAENARKNAESSNGNEHVGVEKLVVSRPA